MEKKNNTWLSELDQAFTQAIKAYQKFERRFPLPSWLKEGMVSDQQGKLNFHSFDIPHTRIIGNLCRKFEKTFVLRDEINSFISNNNIVGYRKLVEEVFGRHYHSVKTFEEAIDFYFNENDSFSNIVRNLSNKNVMHREDEILFASKLDLIYHFVRCENLFASYCNHSPYLINIAEKSSASFINLNYGVKNHQVIDLMYSHLKDKLVDTNEEQFKRHFFPSEKLDKIKWAGTIVQLVVLFNGGTLPDEDFAEKKVKGVRTSVIKVPRMIFDNFCKKNGADFNYETLATECRSNEVKKPQQFDPFLLLLNEIEKLLGRL